MFTTDDVTLTPEDAQNCIVFLGRASLTGVEAPVLVALVQKLSAIQKRPQSVPDIELSTDATAS